MSSALRVCVLSALLVALIVLAVRGFVGEQDRAVLEAISQRLAWLENNVLEEHDRPAFAALVQSLFGPELAALGWDPRPGEPVDLRVKRAVVIGISAEYARITSSISFLVAPMMLTGLAALSVDTQKKRSGG